MARSNIKIKRVCKWCGQEFYVQRSSTKYCSKKCNEKKREVVDRISLK